MSITWSLKGDIVSSDDTMTTSMLGTQASILVITSVDYHHSGVYTCRAQNPAGTSTHSANLKVNGNLQTGTGVFYLQLDVLPMSRFLSPLTLLKNVYFINLFFRSLSSDTS